MGVIDIQGALNSYQNWNVINSLALSRTAKRITLENYYLLAGRISTATYTILDRFICVHNNCSGYVTL